MDEKANILIDSSSSGMRLDQFLAGKYPQYTRSYFSKLIRNKFITVSGSAVKGGYCLKENDSVSVEFHKEQSDLTPVDLPLDIVFEDDDIIVINKPAGLVVHPGKGSRGDTLVNALLHYSAGLSAVSESERPGIVHRLDKFTSGLLVVAKNDIAHHKLRAQFDKKQIRRIYRAIVWGKMNENEGTVHTFINRSRRDPTRMAVSRSGREAVTHFRLLQDFQYVSLLELTLETGRTHQIRVHMNHIHHQVVGDDEYNGRETQLRRLPHNLHKRGQHLLKILTRQALHAKELSFIHPKSAERLNFETPLPQDMQTALDKISDLFLLS